MMMFYAGAEATDLNRNLSDLLCDLLFWSRREGVDFPAALRRAIQLRDIEYLSEQLEE